MSDNIRKVKAINLQKSHVIPNSEYRKCSIFKGNTLLFYVCISAALKNFPTAKCNSSEALKALVEREGTHIAILMSQKEAPWIYPPPYLPRVVTFSASTVVILKSNDQ
jgi:hypothetical protein